MEFKNGWAAAVWLENVNGKKQKVDGVVPVNWLDKGEKKLYWPQGINVLKYKNSPPNKELWYQYDLVSIKLVADEKETCEQYLSVFTCSSASETDNRKEEALKLSAKLCSSLPVPPKLFSEKVDFSSSSVSDKEKTQPTWIQRNSSRLWSSTPKRPHSTISCESSTSCKRPQLSLAASGQLSDSEYESTIPSTEESLANMSGGTAVFPIDPTSKKDPFEKLRFPLSDAEYQKLSLGLLWEIKENVVNCRWPTEEKDSRAIKMMATMEDFNALERELLDEQKRSIMRKSLRQVRGLDTKDQVKMILERLFTVGLLSQFNLAGTKRKDRTGNKRGLKGSALFELIVEVVASSFKKSSRREIVNFIQRKLKNAPDQIGGSRKNQRPETEEKAQVTEEKEEREDNDESGDESADDS